MFNLLLIIIGIVLIFSSVLLRTIIFNLHWIAIYTPIDLFNYIKNKSWMLWNGFGIRMYCGYFGSGKSMLASRFIVNNYNKYKDGQTPLNILSNIPLSVPYTPLVNIQQILEVKENTIIFIDECNTLFNARAWKDFPTELVYQLCQNRKKHIMLIMTAPRFHLVDKSIRDVTEYVYQCKRMFWRLHSISVYDGWDLENALNINLLRPLSRQGVFARNKYYNNYDSFAIIDNVKKTEFLDKSEILSNRGVATYQNVYDHKSRKAKQLHNLNK